MNEIATTITSIASSVITAVGNGASTLANAFFTRASDGGAITGLSGLGYFVAIGLGISLVGLTIRFVTRFIRSR